MSEGIKKGPAQLCQKVKQPKTHITGKILSTLTFPWTYSITLLFPYLWVSLFGIRYDWMFGV